jgi:hypothetical protein
MLLANLLLSALLCLVVAADSHSEGEEEIGNSSSVNVHDLLRMGNSGCQDCQQRQDHSHPDAQSIEQDIPSFQHVMKQEPSRDKIYQKDASDESQDSLKHNSDRKENVVDKANQVVDAPDQFIDTADQFVDASGQFVNTAGQVVESSLNQPDPKDQEIDADLIKESQRNRSFSESDTKDNARYMKICKELGKKYGNLFLIHAHHYGNVLWALADHYGQIGLANVRIYGNLAAESLKKYGKLGGERAKKFGHYSFRKAIQAKDYAQNQYAAYLSERAKKSSK